MLLQNVPNSLLLSYRSFPTSDQQRVLSTQTGYSSLSFNEHYRVLLIDNLKMHQASTFLPHIERCLRIVGTANLRLVIIRHLRIDRWVRR